MPELVINVSNYVSPHCYSVLKAEPYTSCSFMCPYCYSRWYWRTAEVAPRYVAIRELRNFIKYVWRRDLRPIPVRLSTLSDPFQEIEKSLRYVLKVLELLIEWEYPVIVNTKSTLISEEPWASLLKKLADLELLLIQVSLPTIDSGLAKKLEPRVPEPRQRIKAVSQFSVNDVPVVVRLSPFIPGVSTAPSTEELAITLKEAGVKHVIVEGIRMPPNDLRDLLRKLGSTEEVKLQTYSLQSAGLAKVDVSSLLKYYRQLRTHLDLVGIKLGTCKEGLYSIESALDCCGIYMIKAAALRPTLREIYRYLLDHGPVPTSELRDVLYSRICKSSRYLCGEELLEYPRDVAKCLINHEKKLLKVATNPQLLEKVCPSLKIQDLKLYPVR